MPVSTAGVEIWCKESMNRWGGILQELPPIVVL